MPKEWKATMELRFVRRAYPGNRYLTPDMARPDIRILQQLWVTADGEGKEWRDIPEELE